MIAVPIAKNTSRAHPRTSPTRVDSVLLPVSGAETCSGSGSVVIERCWKDPLHENARGPVTGIAVEISALEKILCADRKIVSRSAKTGLSILVGIDIHVKSSIERDGAVVDVRDEQAAGIVGDQYLFPVEQVSGSGYVIRIAPERRGF